jgi:hypothetical protein
LIADFFRRSSSPASTRWFLSPRADWNWFTAPARFFCALPLAPFCPQSPDPCWSSSLQQWRPGPSSHCRFS